MGAVDRYRPSGIARRSHMALQRIDSNGVVDDALVDDEVRRAQARASALTDVTGSAMGEALRLSKLKAQFEMMAPEASGALSALEEVNTIGLLQIVSQAQRDLGRLR